MMVNIGKIKGFGRLQLIRQHRLTVFEKTFDKYIEGKVPAEVVANRGLKLKAVKTKGRRKTRLL